VSRRPALKPAKSTIRGRLHAARRKAGFGVYRVTVHEDQLTALVRRGRLTDWQTTDVAAVERALTEHLGASLLTGFQ
jgi:hypothetical protein